VLVSYTVNLKFHFCYLQTSDQENSFDRLKLIYDLAMSVGLDLCRDPGKSKTTDYLELGRKSPEN